MVKKKAQSVPNEKTISANIRGVKMMFIIICIFCLIGFAIALTVITKIIVAKIKRQSQTAETTAQGYDVCDSCGKFPKQPNSMLCKERETKANDN